LVGLDAAECIKVLPEAGALPVTWAVALGAGCPGGVMLAELTA
jgi:hypothetical protein